ncbi:50S ribosomal protein L17 [Candidatus Dependentiae bacterium]|nr:50S ribosomal protein L17 [Candidatus Dependentiae bacterium]
MRHNKNKVKLNRTAAHRKALMRNMLTSLILEKKIKTTLPKAKALKSYADKFLCRVRPADLSAKRKAFSILMEKRAGKELFENVIPQLGDRKSGFIRIYHFGIRKGDAAKMALVHLILGEDTKSKTAAPKVKKEKVPKKKAEKPKPKAEIKEEKVEELAAVAGTGKAKAKEKPVDDSKK